MALITCPECSKEISDRVKSCPHCGFPLTEENNETQKVEISSVNLKMGASKKKKLITLIVSILVIGVVVFVGYLSYSKQKAKEYSTNVNLLMSEMLSSGSDAESLMNLTSKVWSNTIYKKFDSETDKYTRKNGYWESDFNNSLDNLFKDSSTKTKIENIKSSEVKVSEMMKKLQKPPKEYEKLYDTLLELNSSYQATIDLAKSPQGNITAFNNNKNEKISKFMEVYKKIQTQLPNSN